MWMNNVDNASVVKGQESEAYSDYVSLRKWLHVLKDTVMIL